MARPTPSDPDELLGQLQALATELEQARPGSLDQHQLLVAILRALIYLVERSLE